MTTPHPLKCVLKQLHGPQIPMTRVGAQERKEKVTGPWRSPRAAKVALTATRHLPSARLRWWTMKLSNECLPQQPSPKYKKANIFSHRSHHPRLHGSPLTPAPHLPLWCCEPAAPTPISSYYCSGAPAVPPQMLSTTKKKKGSCVYPEEAGPIVSKNS